MDENKERELVKECQEWRNSLTISIGFPENFIFNKIKINNVKIPDEEIKNHIIGGIVDPDRPNMYQGYYINEKKEYCRCLFRVYLPNEWEYLSNELLTYSLISRKKEIFKKEDKTFDPSFQNLHSVIYSKQSQAIILCLDYIYLMNFSDFKFALHILPDDIKIGIIYKILLSMLSILNDLFNTLKLAHRSISEKTIIFNLDSKPILTNFSTVSPVDDKKELEIKDLEDLGDLFEKILHDSFGEPEEEEEEIAEKKEPRDFISLNNFYDNNNEDPMNCLDFIKFENKKYAVNESHRNKTSKKKHDEEKSNEDEVYKKVTEIIKDLKNGKFPSF